MHPYIISILSDTVELVCALDEGKYPNNKRKTTRPNDIAVPITFRRCILLSSPVIVVLNSYIVIYPLMCFTSDQRFGFQIESNPLTIWIRHPKYLLGTMTIFTYQCAIEYIALHCTQISHVISKYCYLVFYTILFLKFAIKN
jgi:hypothetical protein